MPVAYLLFADGDEGGEQVDDAFKVSSTTAGPRPLIMQRIEAMAGIRIEDDQVLFLAAGFGIGNPVLRLFGFGCKNQAADVWRAQKAICQIFTCSTAFA
jgi:hypothetical protein